MKYFENCVSFSETEDQLSRGSRQERYQVVVEIRLKGRQYFIVSVGFVFAFWVLVAVELENFDFLQRSPKIKKEQKSILLGSILAKHDGEPLACCDQT